MKLRFESPELKINKFNIENIITTSGGAVEKTIAEKMSADGYSVSSVNLMEITL